MIISELSKFRRNDLVVVNGLENILDSRLNPLYSYLNYSDCNNSIKDLLYNCLDQDSSDVFSVNNIFYTNFDANDSKYELLIYLPINVEDAIKYMNILIRNYEPTCVGVNLCECFTESNDFRFGHNSKFSNMHKDVYDKFLGSDSDGIKRYVVTLGYSYFTISNADFSICYDYKYIMSLKDFIVSGYDNECLNNLFNCCRYLPNSDTYIYDKDYFFNSIEYSLKNCIVNTDKDEKKADDIFTASPLELMRSDKQSAYNPLGYFNSDYDKALNDLNDIKTLVISSKEFEHMFVKYIYGKTIDKIYTDNFSLSRLHCWLYALMFDCNIISIKYSPIKTLGITSKTLFIPFDGNRPKPFVVDYSVINIVKDLPKLLYRVYTNNSYNQRSSVDVLTGGYISKEKESFRVPYDIANGKFFADGNLSKQRAIKKFIDALTCIGYNLCDFDIIIN